MDKSTHPSSDGPRAAYGAWAASQSATPEVAFGRHQQPLSQASQALGKGLAPDARLEPSGLLPYPTPPASSSSSTRRTSEAGSDRSSKNRESDPSNACRPGTSRQQSSHIAMPLRTRRQTGGLNPLSNIATSSPVHATHISNPASSRSSTRPSTPTSETPARTALSSLNSHLELVKLTDDVASPRNKNTPPLTPRALSNDGSESAKQSNRASDLQNGKTTHAGTTQGTPHSSPPVGPPKGKLSVIVSHARGLRPSHNPYAVTVFEWIESVARPSKEEQSEYEPDSRGIEQPYGGVPIKKSRSDMGRSIAIPMKSRQSSTTSLSDQKEFKNGRHITEPRWDHVALL